MDRVLSARLDEKVIEELDFATRKLHMTKKQFLEEASRMRAKETRIEERLRILHESAGAWKREESAEETIAAIRKASEDAYRRNLVPGTDHW